MVMVLKSAIPVLQALTALEMTLKLCALQAQLLMQVPPVLMTVKSLARQSAVLASTCLTQSMANVTTASQAATALMTK